MRKPGFYWVKYDTDSQSIALWSGKYWHVIDEPQSKLADENMYEIDERRIERQTNEGCNTDSGLQRIISNIIDVMIYSGAFVETNKLHSIKNDLKHWIESQQNGFEDALDKAGDDPAKREPGFYWVKKDDNWTVSFYVLGTWTYHGTKINDDDLQLICENVIKEPYLVRIERAQNKTK